MLCVPPYLIEMSVEWKSRRSMRLEKSFNGFYSDESLQLLENCKYSIKTTFNPRRCLLALFQMLIGLNCRMIAPPTKMLVIYSSACAKKTRNIQIQHVRVEKQTSSRSYQYFFGKNSTISVR